MGAELTGSIRQRRLRVGLGTFLAVEAAAPSAEQVASAIEGAFAAIFEVERRMHPAGDGSDLARINAAPAHPSSAIAIHRSTWELLELAKQLNELSDGAFDPCLPCRPGRLTDVELLPSFNVRCHAPVRLDFGGFAKGYAVDQAIETLMQHGCDAGLVNAGGDLRVFGTLAQTVLLRENGRAFRPLQVTNAAVAVSDTDKSRRPPEHAGYYSRTQTASDPDAVDISVAIVANQAVLADALTKCALLCTAQELEQLILSLTSSTRGRSIAPAFCTTHADIRVHCAARFGDIVPGMRSR